MAANGKSVYPLLLFTLLSFLLFPPLNFAQTCSSQTSCAQGCCSKSGYCGFGPSYCGAGNCTSSCDAKAQCGQYALSNSTNCPLNVCCSQYGFCGTTSDFCNPGTCQNGCAAVQRPSASGSSSSQRRIGYYESWSATRPCNAVQPQDIDPTLWTHLYYSFALIGPDHRIAAMNSYDTQYYPQFTALKQQNSGLKTYISVGGWDAGGQVFSNMVSSAANRATFISSAISFMQTYGFDGIDIDWEYPVAPDRGGNAADKANYVSLLRELRVAFGGRYGLTATLPTSYWYMQGFDIVNMADYLDWFNFMSYDIHGTWDGNNPYTQRVVNPHTNLTEISLGLDLLWRNKINPSKVVLGLAFYGRSFTLASSSCNTPGCPFSAGGNPGPCTGTSGILSNSEIKAIIANYSLTPSYNQAAGIKWLNWNSNQWVSYDDETTYAQKKAFADKLGLGGTMVWAIDLDDANSGASLDDLNLNPLRAIGDDVDANKAYAKQKLAAISTQNSINLISLWTDCTPFPVCPPGFKILTSAAGKVFDADLDILGGDACGGGGKGKRRGLCIESNVDTHNCGWFGKPSGCNAGCPAGYTLISQNSQPEGSAASCAANKYSSYCCGSITASVNQVDACPLVNTDFALGGGARTGRSVKRADITNPLTYDTAIAGTDLECSSYENYLEAPFSPYLDPTPGFFPTAIGLVILNALPGIWEFNFALNKYVWQPLFNLAYSQGTPDSNGCIAHVTPTTSETVVVPTITTRPCDGRIYPQACLHYSSVSYSHPAAPRVLICPTATPVDNRNGAPSRWSRQHHRTWNFWVPVFYKPAHRGGILDNCNRDEYPPYTFGYPPEFQYIRFLSEYENKGAGGIFKDICSYPPRSSTSVHLTSIGRQTCYYSEAVTKTVNALSLTFVSIPNLPSEGLGANPCFPQTLTNDAGYALLTQDDWYKLYSPSASSEVYKTPLVALPAITAGKTQPRVVAAKRSLSAGPGKSDFYIDEGNSTREATADELWENWQIIKCKSEDCADELSDWGLTKDDVIDPWTGEHNLAHIDKFVAPVTSCPGITATSTPASVAAHVASESAAEQTISPIQAVGQQSV